MRFVGERLGEGRAKKTHDEPRQDRLRRKRPTTRYEDKNGPPPGGCVADPVEEHEHVALESELGAY
jgi:hypothetical protein